MYPHPSFNVLTLILIHVLRLRITYWYPHASLNLVFNVHRWSWVRSTVLSYCTLIFIPILQVVMGEEYQKFRADSQQSMDEWIAALQVQSIVYPQYYPY
jgi:hypothetical protein